MNRTLLLTTLFVIFAVSATHADIIQIAIQARVSQVDDPANLLQGNIAPDDLITGTYTYNSDTPDTNPLSTVGDYWHNDIPFGVCLFVGGYEFRSDPDGISFLLEIADNHLVGSPFDKYEIISYNNLPLSPNIPVESISWALVDYDSNILSTTELPSTPPSLLGWNTNTLSIYNTKGAIYNIEACVESAVLVPEPGMICILSLGVLGLIRRGKH